MKVEQLLANNNYKISYLSQGIHNNIWYYGKVIPYKNKHIELVITSDKKTYANYKKLEPKDNKSNENKEYINEIKDNFGLIYSNTPIEMNNFWSNNSIQDFIVTKENIIDNKELYNKIKNQITKYMDLYDERISTVITLYILSTYAYQMFNSTGYILLTSEKASGKTKFLDLISLMSYNSISVSSPSQSALFRLIEANKGLLVIDDMEIQQHKDEKSKYLLELLRIGYRKNGCIIRNEQIDNKFVPTLFNVYSPKVISNTSGLDPITLSRCIVINLLPTQTNKGKLTPNDEDTIWQEIRDRCHIFVLENYKDIQKIYLNYDNSLFNNRQMELIKGLLSIAKLLGKEIHKEAEEYLNISFNDRDLQDLSSDWEYIILDRKSTRLNSSHTDISRMPSSA